MEKKRISIEGNLYVETTPENWAKDIIEKYNMLPDIKTIYVGKKFVNIIKSCEIFYNINKLISFDIETENGEIELNGVVLDAIPLDERRNCYDFLFIPDFNLIKLKEIENAIGKTKYDILKIIHLGHFINMGTAKNFKLKN